MGELKTTVAVMLHKSASRTSLPIAFYAASFIGDTEIVAARLFLNQAAEE
jgi:hypothetical protein